MNIHTNTRVAIFIRHLQLGHVMEYDKFNAFHLQPEKGKE